jgi:hypothetical protein
MISYPFTVRDICLVTDGGGAVIVTTDERARSLKKPPAYGEGVMDGLKRGSAAIEPLAAGEGADDPRVEHRPVRLGAPLTRQLIALEVRLVNRQRGFRHPLHFPLLHWRRILSA